MDPDGIRRPGQLGLLFQETLLPVDSGEMGSSPLYEDSWVPRRDLQKSLLGLLSRVITLPTPGRLMPGIKPQLTDAPLLLLHGKDTPTNRLPFCRGRSPMRGPPRGTQKVYTVPSLPTIWGHGGGGNKVKFQRFLVQRRKANAVVSWTYKSCTLLFP